MGGGCSATCLLHRPTLLLLHRSRRSLRAAVLHSAHHQENGRGGRLAGWSARWAGWLAGCPAACPPTTAAPPSPHGRLPADPRCLRPAAPRLPPPGRVRRDDHAADRGPVCRRRALPPRQRRALSGAVLRASAIGVGGVLGCPPRIAAPSSHAPLHSASPAARTRRRRRGAQWTGERRLHIALPWLAGGVFMAVLPTVTNNGGTVRRGAVLGAAAAAGSVHCCAWAGDGACCTGLLGPTGLASASKPAARLVPTRPAPLPGALLPAGRPPPWPSSPAPPWASTARTGPTSRGAALTAARAGAAVCLGARRLCGCPQ